MADKCSEKNVARKSETPNKKYEETFLVAAISKALKSNKLSGGGNVKPAMVCVSKEGSPLPRE